MTKKNYRWFGTYHADYIVLNVMRQSILNPPQITLKVKMDMQILPLVKEIVMEKDAAGFDPEMIKEEKIALVAHIYPDSDFKQQVDVLNDLSKIMKNIIQIFLLDEDAVRKYHEFDISGSPTFIFFYNGEEKGRLLGKADTKTLIDFISNHLLEMI